MIVHQVGCKGYRIDLAVRHPQQPGMFVMGIECDGATYHRSRSARDRDRLRQAILEGLGWNIYRIWSTDWFINKTSEISCLHTALQSAISNAPVIDDTITSETEPRSTSDPAMPPDKAQLIIAEQPVSIGEKDFSHMKL